MAIQSWCWLEVLVHPFPKNYENAWTLAGPVLRSGVGLHSGLEAEVRLLPHDHAGFYVSRRHREEDPILLRPTHVRDSQLCTTLELGNYSLATVEHLLAALAGCGLTHVHIEVSGSEIPLLDGSALGWVEAIEEVGITQAGITNQTSLVLQGPLFFSRGNSVIVATPAESFSLLGMIDFPQEAIGRQVLALELTPEKFVTEIAPARTFGFLDQLEQLQKSGLIKGGTLENALVCDGAQWVNPPLRFPDEPVRHKLLDLIGDLALVGFPRAQVLVYKGSHGLHADLANGLFKNCSSH